MFTHFSSLTLVSYQRFLLASHQNMFSDKPDCEEVTLGWTGVSHRRIFLACE